MTRHHLLTLARQYVYSNSSALALAEQLTTDADVQSAALQQSALVSREDSRTELFFRAFIGLGLVFVAAVLLLSARNASALSGLNTMWCATAMAVSLMGLLTAAALGLRAANRRICAEDHLKLLAPVVNSPACQSALEFVEAGEPNVLAWRDLAVADRDVLYAFDVFVMRDLHYAALAARDAARIQSAQEAACRQLYGIAAAEPVGA